MFWTIVGAIIVAMILWPFIIAVLFSFLPVFFNKKFWKILIALVFWTLLLPVCSFVAWEFLPENLSTGIIIFITWFGFGGWITIWFYQILDKGFENGGKRTWEILNTPDSKQV